MTCAAASNATIATKIQHVANGDALVVKSGGTINVEEQRRASSSAAST